MPLLLAVVVALVLTGCATPIAGRHLFALPHRVVCEGARLGPCGLELLGCKGERSTWTCIHTAQYLGPWSGAPFPPDFAPDPD